MRSTHPTDCDHEPSSNQFFADGPDGRLGTVGDADLAEDVLHVLLDRLVADVQRLAISLFVRP